MILCFKVLLRWINDILEDRRILVRHIQEDIYDGQVLAEMLGQSYVYIMTVLNIHSICDQI